MMKSGGSMRPSAAGNFDCSAEGLTKIKDPLDHFVTQALSRRRFVLGFFYANLLWWNVTYAQRSSISFGPCTDRSLGYSPRSLTVTRAAAGRGGEIAILSGDSPVLHVVTLAREGTLADTESIALPGPQESVSLFEDERQGKPSYLLVAQDGMEISIVHRSPHKTTLQTFHTPVRVQRVTTADINNDKLKDLLFFGKSTAGVATLLGKADGTFTEGPLLFPEISVSDMHTMDLNGDGITDVMLLSWLSNECMVFYGITDTVFSEQVTIQLPGEPADLGATEVTRDRRIRAAITIPNEERIVCLTGNSAGEFEVDGSIPTPPRPAGIVLTDVNGDGLPDVISSTSEGVMVSLAQGERSFTQPAFFGEGDPETLWGVSDLTGDRQPDLVIARRAKAQLYVVANAHHSSPFAWHGQYMVGASPHGVCLADFNGDGLPDVAVANTRSSTLSLLLNRGEGRFDGQISLSVEDHPVYLRSTPAHSREGYTLLVSHPRRDLITVVNLFGDLTHPAFYAMPTGDNPYVLRANDDPRTRKFEILVRYKNERDASLSLSLFEQLSGKLFLERNLHAKVPHRIMALTAADIIGHNDLVVATHDRASGLSAVSLVRSSGKFEFKNVQPLFSFVDSTSSVRSLLCRSSAGSPTSEIYVVLGEPRNAIGVSRATAPGTFSDSLLWIRDVRLRDDASIDFQDVDGDSVHDVTVLDAGKKAIVVYYGTRDGRFEPPSVICAAPDARGFAIGSLVEHGRRDLVLTHGAQGTVSMLFHPFRR
jgi:hypothetical protein